MFEFGLVDWKLNKSLYYKRKNVRILVQLVFDDTVCRCCSYQYDFLNQFDINFIEYFTSMLLFHYKDFYSFTELNWSIQLPIRAYERNLISDSGFIGKSRMLRLLQGHAAQTFMYSPNGIWCHITSMHKLPEVSSSNN